MDAFDRLVTDSARMDLSFPVETPLRFYIRTHTEEWLTGSVKVLISIRPIFTALLDGGNLLPAGTSGSLVFNQNGEVMGIVSEGGSGGGSHSVTVAWLAGALQMWHVRELDDWRRENASD